MLFRCPACGELLEALTTVHCTARHDLNRKELIERFGPPEFITLSVSRDVQRWISEAQVIRRLDFDMAQAAARNQFGRRAGRL